MSYNYPSPIASPTQVMKWVSDRLNIIFENYREFQAIISDLKLQEAEGINPRTQGKELEDFTIMTEVYIYALEEVTQKLETLVSKYVKMMKKLDLLADESYELHNLIKDTTGDEHFLIRMKLLESLGREALKMG